MIGRSPQGKPQHAGPRIDSPDPLLPFLLNPRSYPHRPRQVRGVQTHSSFVFLVPPYVYKVKKSVDFGFLDFSTLEKRRHFCEREVALNRRLSPGIYLGVVPISRHGDGLVFGDGDTVVEYAVKMRALSPGGFLDRLVSRRKVRPSHLDRVARVLKRFYEAQHPTQALSSWGRIGRLRISTDENFRQTRPFIGTTITAPAFAAIRHYTHGFYARHTRLFAARVRERRIRDCHGDLHLEHIHITPRSLNIYDCIEFNDRFRQVDVASDVAFLAMDLDYEGRPDLARHFATRMGSVLRDAGLPRLLDFYKCYRAFVRGKVESLHGIAPAAPEEEREASAGRARRYFRLALQYAVAGSRPLVLVVMGCIASGKSTLAQALGAELGWEVHSSDSVRKTLAGLPLHRRSRGEARSRLYSPAMTDRTYDRLLSIARTQLGKGRSVILDATFGRRAHRDRLAARLAGVDGAWRFLEVQAGDAAVRRRLRMREGRTDEISDARLPDFERLTAGYEPPLELPAGRFTRVRAGTPIHRTVTLALQKLARLQLECENDARDGPVTCSGVMKDNP